MESNHPKNCSIILFFFVRPSTKKQKKLKEEMEEKRKSGPRHLVNDYNGVGADQHEADA